MPGLARLVDEVVLARDGPAVDAATVRGLSRWARSERAVLTAGRAGRCNKMTYALLLAIICNFRI